MFQTKFVEKVKTHILCAISFFDNRTVYEIRKCYSRAGEATDDNITRRMLFACWITKAINTHSEYVILIACLMQLWLCELACMLRHTYIARLVLYFLHSLLIITVTESNQQPDLRFSIDRSLPAAEQRTVLPTAQWVLPFLRKIMDFFFLWLEQGCTRFPKNI